MMSDAIREFKIDMFQKQSEIIKKQSDAIDGLLKLLLMHMEAEDVDQLQEIGAINEAAEIKAELGL